MPEGTTLDHPGRRLLLVGHAARTGSTPRRCCPRAVTDRVAYVPGTGFYADGQGRQNMRLSYCYPEPERIREGVRRLAAVIEAELELAETFGTHARPATHGRRAPTVPAPEPRSRSRPHARAASLSPAASRRARRLAALGPPRRRGAARRPARREVAGARRRRRRCSPRCAADRPDCIVPLLHGAAGEDGAIRDVLESLRRPVRRLDAAAVPARLRQAGRQGSSSRSAGIAHARAASPAARRRSASSGAAAVLDAVVDRLGLPLVVKPTTGGSALGTSIVAPRRGPARGDGRRLRLRRRRALERYVAGIEVASASSSATATARACRRSRSCPTAALRLRRALHRRDHRVLLPGPARPTRPPSVRRRWPCTPTCCSGCATCRAPT